MGKRIERIQICPLTEHLTEQKKMKFLTELVKSNSQVIDCNYISQALKILSQAFWPKLICVSSTKQKKNNCKIIEFQTKLCNYFQILPILNNTKKQPIQTAATHITIRCWNLHIWKKTESNQLPIRITLTANDKVTFMRNSDLMGTRFSS